MTEELEQLFNSTYLLRQQLSQVLPKEAVDYIVHLVIMDRANQNYTNL